MILESQKRAAAKWSTKNMAVLSTHIRKETAEAFRAKCAKAGTTPNTAIKNFIESYIKEDENKDHQETND